MVKLKLKMICIYRDRVGVGGRKMVKLEEESFNWKALLSDGKSGGQGSRPKSGKGKR
jgi:hypothetical protein